jgi:predicted metalloprotease with PDZ domain
MKTSKSRQVPRSFWLGLAVLIFMGSQAAFCAPLPGDLFNSLCSPEFQKREAAEAKLLEWCRMKPEAAKEELFKQYHSAEDPEARIRCLSILRALVFDDYSREGEGYIGINMGDDTSLVPGDGKPRSVIRVIAAMPDTAAANAGIQPNDLIVGLDDEVWHDVKASEPFMKRIRSMKPNQKVQLKILRGNTILDVAVILGRRPVAADLQSFQGESIDLLAAERAAKEAYFRRWLSEKKRKKNP